MIEYEDCVHYKVLGSDIKFYCDETCYGYNVVAEYNDNYYYLGSETVGILTAVCLWEEQNKKKLSNDELKRVMIENNLVL